MGYTVKKVSSKREMDDFVELPRFIYRDNPYYVPDMDSDVRGMFVERKNPGLEHSSIQCFVAYDGAGRCVGRIVGIVNRWANEIWNTHDVRFGMIEFIDDAEVSAALLNAVETWGREQGMDRIVGPLGITDFDKEGMLVSDFDQKGSMVTIYNHAYYPRHMAGMNFEKEAEWVQMRIDIPRETPKRIRRVAQLTREMYELRTVKFTRHQILKEGYGKRIFDLFNAAYAPLFGFSKLSDKQQIQYINKYIPLLDLRLMSVVVDRNDRMVGVAISIGSLTDALQKSKGRLMPIGWLHLLKELKLKHENKIEMILVAVDPEFQGLGVNALFFDDLIPIYNELGYTWGEVAPQLETNMKVLTQWRDFHPLVYKHRICYSRKIVAGK